MTERQKMICDTVDMILNKGVSLEQSIVTTCFIARVDYSEVIEALEAKSKQEPTE